MSRKLLKFLILFDNTSLLYFPGQFLSGRVLIELQDETPTLGEYLGCDAICICQSLFTFVVTISGALVQAEIVKFSLVAYLNVCRSWGWLEIRALFYSCRLIMINTSFLHNFKCVGGYSQCRDMKPNTEIKEPKIIRHLQLDAFNETPKMILIEWKLNLKEMWLTLST